MEIALVDVTKRFGDFVAVDRVSLRVHSGELVALLGPSGSGKTTLLRMIAGLEQPDQGEVQFDQQDAPTNVGERHVGFVFQHYALFRHMTVFENIAFGLRAKPRGERPPERVIAASVHALLNLVQLDWLADRYPSQLSGGQRQRIALARALAIEPQVLLLDEPFGALDAKVRKELRRWLRHLHEKIHVTSVFVTHDQEEALEVADRVVVMDKGRIEQAGAPRDVYENPQTAFVHEFIGESIALPVALREGQVLFEDTPLNIDGQGVTSARGRLFMRPYDVTLVAPDDSELTGTVRRVHGIGPARRLEIALGRSGATLVEVDAPRTQQFEVGAVVGLRPRVYRVFAA
jgi:sulfate transport system ATP-binding protein